MTSRILLLGLGLSAGGCLGLFPMGETYLRVEGQVYQWQAPPAGSESKILMESTITSPTSDGVPIEGCSIVAGPFTLPSVPTSAEAARLRGGRGASNQAGQFSVGIMTNKKRGHEATLYISCPGFKPTFQLFQNVALTNPARAFMVREESPK